MDFEPEFRRLIADIEAQGMAHRWQPPWNRLVRVARRWRFQVQRMLLRSEVGGPTSLAARHSARLVCLMRLLRMHCEELQRTRDAQLRLAQQELAAPPRAPSDRTLEQALAQAIPAVLNAIADAKKAAAPLVGTAHRWARLQAEEERLVVHWEAMQQRARAGNDLHLSREATKRLEVHRRLAVEVRVEREQLLATLKPTLALLWAMDDTLRAARTAHGMIQGHQQATALAINVVHASLELQAVAAAVKRAMG